MIYYNHPSKDYLLTYIKYVNKYLPEFAIVEDVVPPGI